MNIKILGSGNEVGRSAIVVEDDKKILLDCGVKLQPEPPQYPKIEKVDAAIISHAHLDHSGAMPLLQKKGKTPIFMNDITLELSALLIRDSMKVAKRQGYGTPFSKSELKKSIKNTKLVNYNEIFNIGKFRCSLYDAGHIPGSASILLENRKKIFYTADIQTIESNLLNPCKLPNNADILIIESTYSYKDHPKRELEEKRLVQSVEETIAKNEIALIPVFAIGRAQEVLLILKDYTNKIVLDGLAKKASEIIADYDIYLKNPKELRNILRKIKFVKTYEERIKVTKKYPIIISSAGMLGGGPAIHYLREIQKRQESKVLFTGFLVEDTPGRNLIETKIFENAEERFHVHCDLQQFELSAHTDRSGLLEIIKKTKPKQIICVHGDKCDRFAKEIEKQFNIEAFAPNNDEVIRV
ncbi:MAG: MBL fold metallo-hydrolase [Candidatus Aenigmatarchaeota archaeon]